MRSGAVRVAPRAVSGTAGGGAYEPGRGRPSLVALIGSPEGDSQWWGRPAPGTVTAMTDTPPTDEQPTAPIPPRPRLTRSSEDSLIGGVAGGIGRHLGIDPLAIRITFVILTFAGGLGLLLYLAALAFLPSDDPHAAPMRWGLARTVGVGLLAVAAIVDARAELAVGSRAVAAARRGRGRLPADPRRARRRGRPHRPARRQDRHRHRPARARRRRLHRRRRGLRAGRRRRRSPA